MKLSAHKKKRLLTLGAVLCVVAGFVLFIGVALRKNIRFFVTPLDVFSENLLHHTHLRLGGVVKQGSVNQKGLHMRFIITDGTLDIPVSYTGIVPNLFREGQTVVVEGGFYDVDGEESSKLFKATTILAKHDENYKPPMMQKHSRTQMMPKAHHFFHA